jgi:hypothetical protein
LLSARCVRVGIVKEGAYAGSVPDRLLDHLARQFIGAEVSKKRRHRPELVQVCRIRMPMVRDSAQYADS